MTRQEAYDAMREFFSRADAQLARDGEDCFYRMDDGRKCAVGCLIPDELYDSAFDTDNVVLAGVVSEVWPEHHDDWALILFLSAAQARHDRSADPEEFVLLLDDLAVREGLEVRS